MLHQNERVCRVRRRRLPIAEPQQRVRVTDAILVLNEPGALDRIANRGHRVTALRNTQTEVDLRRRRTREHHQQQHQRNRSTNQTQHHAEALPAPMSSVLWDQIAAALRAPHEPLHLWYPPTSCLPRGLRSTTEETANMTSPARFIDTGSHEKQVELPREAVDVSRACALSMSLRSGSKALYDPLSRRKSRQPCGKTRISAA